MVEVHLHGYFKSFHDGPIRMVGETVAEIVEGVTRQIEGFQPHPTRGRHRVKVVGFETEQELRAPIGDTQVIHIVPQLNGAKKGGLLQIVLGAVLVAAGVFLGPTGLGGLLIKVGAMVLLGGIAQLLAPQPENDTDTSDKDKSRYLGAPKNTVAIGTRIPILYGRHRVYGHYISFDINAIEFRGTGKTTTSGGGGK